MFGKLREKLSGWFRKGKEEPEKQKKSNKVVVKREEREVEKKVKKIKEEKAEEEEKEKVSEEKGARPPASKREKEIKEEKVIEKGVEEDLKEKADAILEEVPVEFKTGTQKYEPDVEAIQKRAEELGEETEEEVEEKAVEEKKSFFGFLARKLTTSELKEEDFDSVFDEIEMTLLENNVALGVVDKIKESLKGDLVGKKFSKKEVEGKILGALKNAIDGVLIEGGGLIEKIKRKESKEPFVILFFGINGSGKTTSIAKLAWKLKKEGIEPVLAAGDTFRAASIEQLETHATKIGVEIVKGDYGKDPASVAFDAIAFARKHKKKVVLIDTAGRMYTKQNLMKEMEKIVKVSKPDLKIFVGESITGNDAVEQARTFNETVGIDGIILSKADVDEKAGTILSVSYVTGKPIFYLGVGQKYVDLEEFSKKNVFEGLGLE
ncbi:MAG: signal recognition particle-docking protein FtsY [Nanoarchaeota archaeon]|nr:signal recognition particle-docking protein FtsY [Nanoarchaeota archaeon]MBU1051062.1 signal recognition particle-docking protein FtsY [Nanoarchaeota archaeon]MBU1987913.1 signal recognition particle-docking protein FtsY [Nanoarchaeota archaeon]